MATAPNPIAVRDQALICIASVLRGYPQPQTPLEALGSEVACAVIVGLERAFRIDIDVDEIAPGRPWSAATVGHLLDLTVARVTERAVVADARLFDLAAERARRARIAPPTSASLRQDFAAMRCVGLTRTEPAARPSASAAPPPASPSQSPPRPAEETLELIGAAALAGLALAAVLLLGLLAWL